MKTNLSDLITDAAASLSHLTGFTIEPGFLVFGGGTALLMAFAWSARGLGLGR